MIPPPPPLGWHGIYSPVVVSQEGLRWLNSPVKTPSEIWKIWLNTPVKLPVSKLQSLRKRKRTQLDDDPRCSIRSDDDCGCENCVAHIFSNFNK